MPSLEKKEKSQLTTVVDDFINAKRDSNAGGVDFLSIIDFIDRFNLLPQGLFPVQKFVLKLYYGIPLDDKIPANEGDRIRVASDFRLKKCVYLSEVDYLEYLYNQGRCNIKKQEKRHRHELILVLGRRAGKSIMSSIIAAYELYKLLRRSCPQAYYGLPITNQIRILSIANDKGQAEIVYQDINGYVNSIDYFKSSLAHNTTEFMKFRTQSDKQKFGDKGKSSITATFKSSIAKGLRGHGVICFILDEFAFFVNDSGKSNAREIYRAISPSLKTFTPKDPDDKRKAIGPSEGRTIVISSPDAQDGFFFNLYQMALAGGVSSNNMLMIQAPTWEVNPTLSNEDYEVEFAKDPRAFETEYGAKFSDRVRGWIEDAKDLTDCIDLNLRPSNRGQAREPHFAGVDFALVNDGTAVALSHIKNGKIELAYHEAWYAGKKWKEINPHLEAPLVSYADSLQDVKRLDVDEIIKWLVALSRRFFILKGVFDQWAGTIFEQKLHKEKLNQFEMRHFSVSDSSKMYQNIKMMMYSNQLSIYDYPRPESIGEVGEVQYSSLIKELLELQAYSAGKNLITVEAPKVNGKHDDVSDAFARSLFLASEYISENPNMLGGRSVSIPMPERQFGYRQYQRMKNRLHGGPPPERRVPSRR